MPETNSLQTLRLLSQEAKVVNGAAYWGAEVPGRKYELAASRGRSESSVSDVKDRGVVAMIASGDAPGAEKD